MTRLRGSSDLRRVLERGERYGDDVLAVRALRRAGDGAGDGVRIAVSVGKRFGKAVQRNRIRRQVRECARAVAGSCEGAWDIVFMPRAAARTITHDQLRESISRLLRRAGICGAGEQA